MIDREKSHAPRWRKKPIVIDAWRFAIDDLANMPSWIDCEWLAGESIYIPTLEGVMEARCGDWVIRGVKGEVYPCKADIFAATYEKVTP